MSLTNNKTGLKHAIIQLLSTNENARFALYLEKDLTHKLLIEDANKDDAGVYSFTVPTQDISTSGKLVVQSKFLQCLVAILDCCSFPFSSCVSH